MYSIRKNSRHYAILDELRASDVLLMSLFSGRNTRRMHQLAYQKAKERYMNKQAVLQLQKKGLVTIKHGAHGERAHITSNGRSLFHMQQLRHVRDKKNTSWDKKWRITFFDFPETQRHARNEFRSILKLHGWIQIQRSVWVHPYPCTELELFLSSNTKLSQWIHVAECTSISNEQPLKKHFKLS